MTPRITILDNFLPLPQATAIAAEFPPYDSPHWTIYDSPLENKRANNNWNSFPPATYQFFSRTQHDLLQTLTPLYPNIPLFADPGLHGGGQHIHGPSGNLNPHLDYSIHPKLRLKRFLNLILYLSSPSPTLEQGGAFGLWANSSPKTPNTPGRLLQEIQPLFNRAILFETENQWHGLSRPFIPSPATPYRKSLAVYYLTTPSYSTNPRERALFSARGGQKLTSELQALITIRSQLKT